MREVSEDNLFPNGEASEMYIVYYVIEPSVPGRGGGTLYDGRLYPKGVSFSRLIGKGRD